MVNRRYLWTLTEESSQNNKYFHASLIARSALQFPGFIAMSKAKQNEEKAE